jgi:hydroxymethylglutaryl-CoA reductase
MGSWSWDKPVDKSLVSAESLVHKQENQAQMKKAASHATGGFLKRLGIKLFRRRQKQSLPPPRLCAMPQPRKIRSPF